MVAARGAGGRASALSRLAKWPDEPPAAGHLANARSLCWQGKALVENKKLEANNNGPRTVP